MPAIITARRTRALHRTVVRNRADAVIRQVNAIPAVNGEQGAA
jgi:hypothetical protein